MPALRAARQMVRAFSSAILSPCWGSAWPIADSFTETSACRVSPRADSAVEHVEVGLHGGVGLVGVEGVLAEVVEGDPQVVVDQAGGRVDGVLGRPRPARSCARSRPSTGMRADQALDPAAAGEQQQRLSEQRHAGQATSWIRQPRIWRRSGASRVVSAKSW